MDQCPRCGDVVERLHPLPVEAVGATAGTGSDGESRACRWCRHELLEG